MPPNWSLDDDVFERYKEAGILWIIFSVNK
jgi:hypothetical protein